MTHVLRDLDAKLPSRPSSGNRFDPRVKLELVVEHEPPERTILFTLDRPLPAESAGNYFRYAGLVVTDGSMVKDPRVDYCESAPVRNFLNGFSYYPHLLVTYFGLMQVELFYGMGTTYGNALAVFVKSCATALSLEDHERVSVVNMG